MHNLLVSKLSRTRVLAVALTMVIPFVLTPVVVAAPEGAQITGIEHVNDRWDKVSVFSPSMNKVIVNDVYKAPSSGAPTFYLLPGIDGGDNLDPGGNFAPGTKSWFGFTDLQGLLREQERQRRLAARWPVQLVHQLGQRRAASSTRPT